MSDPKPSPTTASVESRGADAGTAAIFTARAPSVNSPNGSSRRTASAAREGAVVGRPEVVEDPGEDRLRALAVEDGGPGLDGLGLGIWLGDRDGLGLGLGDGLRFGLGIRLGD